MVEDEADFEICGEAEDVAEALRLDSPCHVIVPVEGWHDTVEHMASLKPKQGMLSA